MSLYFVMCLEALEAAGIVLLLYLTGHYTEAFMLLGYFAV